MFVKNNSKSLNMQKWHFFIGKTVMMAIFIFGVACNKDRIEVDSEWIGLWTGNENGAIYFIDIQKGRGDSSYENVGVETIQGTCFLDEEEDLLKIGAKQFQIDIYPFYNDFLEKEQVQLDGIIFTKS